MTAFITPLTGMPEVRGQFLVDFKMKRQYIKTIYDSNKQLQIFSKRSLL